MVKLLITLDGAMTPDPRCGGNTVTITALPVTVFRHSIFKKQLLFRFIRI